MKMKSLIMAIVLAAGYANASPAPNAVTVRISNFTFQPGNLRIKAGTTIAFKNEDDIPHRVAANDGSFYTRALDTDDVARVTFNKPGVFPYFCTLHPRMQGKIIVTP